MEIDPATCFISAAALNPAPHDPTKNIIGRGRYGEVYEAIWSNTRVAVKVVELSKHNEATDQDGCLTAVASAQVLRTLSQDFYQESKIMFQLNHPRIIRLFRICVTRENICFVMERAVQSLYQFLPLRGPRLTFREKVHIARQIAFGMNELHSSNIIHRDLKGVNILLKEDGSWALTDFGLARFKDESITSVQTQHNFGTVQWNAPEVLEDQKYSQKSDVYSYGMVLHEILTSDLPWKRMSETKIILKVGRGERPEIPNLNATWDGYIELMKKCWAQDPKDRPLFPAILNEIASLDQESVTQQIHQEVDNISSSPSLPSLPSLPPPPPPPPHSSVSPSTFHLSSSSSPNLSASTLLSCSPPPPSPPPLPSPSLSSDFSGTDQESVTQPIHQEVVSISSPPPLPSLSSPPPPHSPASPPSSSSLSSLPPPPPPPLLSPSRDFSGSVLARLAFELKQFEETSTEGLSGWSNRS